MLYLGLALVSLIPGLALKAGLDAHLPIDAGDLKAGLAEIKFGSGVRFWLGATGAAMMTSLLLYPLRKLFSRGRAGGSIGGWFHVHIMFGLLGPVFILYHCNFGYGGSNANVALWMMLCVAGSGVVGQFIYGRASRDFYENRQQAMRHRDAIVAAIASADCFRSWKETLTEEIDSFDVDLLTPRNGLGASLRARWQMEKRKRAITGEIGRYLDESYRKGGLDRGTYLRLKPATSLHVRNYFKIARAASTQSIREQIWARWRMFHLPVFLVMISAVVLHVIAVWGMDAPSKQANASNGDLTNWSSPNLSSSTVRGVDSDTPMTRETADLPSVKQMLSTAPETTPAGTKTPSASAAEATANPSAIKRRQAAPTVALKPAPVRQEARIAPAADVVAPPPISPTTSEFAQTAPAKRDSDPIAELERKLEKPMALGSPPLPALAEQISAMKIKRQAGDFFHSLSETGFELGGKHLKLDCAECHKVPLRETRKETVRGCVDCHRKDDVHKGRRPECGDCHTANRWTQIVKRR